MGLVVIAEHLSPGIVYFIYIRGVTFLVNNFVHFNFKLAGLTTFGFSIFRITFYNTSQDVFENGEKQQYR